MNADLPINVDQSIEPESVPCISVIIPHYQDLNNLMECLRRLDQQTFNKPYEVIVVDDGSEQPCISALKEWASKSHAYDCRIYQQSHQLQGAARNLGAERARAHIILFLQSDVWPEPELIQCHYDFHEANTSLAISTIGPYPFPPELARDRFRHWLETSGHQAKFSDLKDKQELDYWHFYTGNLGMKREHFLKFRFRSDFTSYGWEDICLGYELQMNRGKAIYLEHAAAWHHHELTIHDFFPERMTNIGTSAVAFDRIYPSSGVIPRGIKLQCINVLSAKLTRWALSKIRKEWYWLAESKYWYMHGVKKALKSLHK